MQPLRAHSWAEAHLYLTVTPCPECAHGPWEITTEETTSPAQPGPDRPIQTLQARCLRCGTEKEFVFECAESPFGQETDAAQDLHDPSIQRINPTDAPSDIIDLGQWMSLFYMLVEKAGAATRLSSSKSKSAESRRFGFQAAQCIEEALKFYTEDDELPPKSAFFTEASRRAFAEHPEKFARQKLRDMRSKLPDLHAMARRIAHDALPKRKKPWWQFWRTE